MRFAELQTIFHALNESKGRYLVVGGVAVIAHGYERMTRDLDLVLALDSDPAAGVHCILMTLERLGYRPMPNVSLFDLENPETRKQWVAEKGITVLNLVSDSFERVPIDLFVESPFDFESAYVDANWFPICDELRIPVVSKSCLIEMKRKVGRTSDILDVEKLTQTDTLSDL